MSRESDSTVVSAVIAHGLVVAAVSAAISGSFAVVVWQRPVELVVGVGGGLAAGFVLGATDALASLAHRGERTLALAGCMASVLAAEVAGISLWTTLAAGELPWTARAFRSELPQLMIFAVLAGLVLATGRIAAGPDAPGTIPWRRAIRGSVGTAFALGPSLVLMLVASSNSRRPLFPQGLWAAGLALLSNLTLALGPLARGLEWRLFQQGEESS